MTITIDSTQRTTVASLGGFSDLTFNGLVVGDVLVHKMHRRNTVNGATITTQSGPATLSWNVATTTSNSQGTIQIAYAVVGTAGNYVVRTQTVSGSAGSQYAGVIVSVLKGVDPVTPIHTAGTSSRQTTATTSPTCPSYSASTVGVNGWALDFIGLSDDVITTGLKDVGSWAGPSNYTYNVVPGAGSDLGLSAAWQNVADGGTVPSATATLSGSNAYSRAQVVFRELVPPVSVPVAFVPEIGMVVMGTIGAEATVTINPNDPEMIDAPAGEIAMTPGQAQVDMAYPVTIPLISFTLPEPLVGIGAQLDEVDTPVLSVEVGQPDVTIDPNESPTVDVPVESVPAITMTVGAPTILFTFPVLDVPVLTVTPGAAVMEGEVAFTISPDVPSMTVTVAVPDILGGLSLFPVNSNACDWGIEWAEVGVCCAPPELDEAHQLRVIAQAVALVWTATGRRYGVCTDVARPCLSCGCREPGYCGCTMYDAIDLDPEGDRPVAAIDYVKLSGVGLTPGEDFVVDRRRWLIRTPSGTRWPTCQDRVLQPAPLEVRWRHGLLPPDDLILNAVYPLVAEMARACAGEACGLDPSLVESVQREGVSFALVEKGGGNLTGNRLIDNAIMRDPYYNLSGSAAPAGILDPADMPDERTSLPEW